MPQGLTYGLTPDMLDQILGRTGRARPAAAPTAPGTGKGAGDEPDEAPTDGGFVNRGAALAGYPSGAELAALAGQQGFQVPGGSTNFNVPLAQAGLAGGRPVFRQDVQQGAGQTQNYYGGPGPGMQLVGSSFQPVQRQLTPRDFEAAAFVNTSPFETDYNALGARRQAALGQYADYLAQQQRQQLGLMGEQRLSAGQAATNALEQGRLGLAGRAQDLAEAQGQHAMSSDRVYEQGLATLLANKASPQEVKRFVGNWKQYVKTSAIPGGGDAALAAAKGPAGWTRRPATRGRTPCPSCPPTRPASCTRPTRPPAPSSPPSTTTTPRTSRTTSTST